MIIQEATAAIGEIAKGAATEATAEYSWGTVIGTAPLRVVRDQSEISLGALDSLVSGLKVEDRVWLIKPAGRWVVVGKAGGIPFPPPPTPPSAPKQWATRLGVNFTSSSPHSLAVTFPAGLFSQWPAVVLTPEWYQPNVVLTAQIANIAPGAAVMWVQRMSGTGTVNFHLHAIERGTFGN